MAIYLVRHGETDFNAKRIVQFPDTPLSARGRAQAERVAGRLAEAGVAAILSSDYARARMTAEAVAARTGLPIEFEPLLRERNFGDHRGSAHDALGFELHAEGYHPPGGESWEMFRDRCRRAWAAVERHAAGVDGDLAVISHGLVCRVLVEEVVAPAEGIDVTRLAWKNTCVSVFDGAPLATTLAACAVHIDDTEAADTGQVAGL